MTPEKKSCAGDIVAGWAVGCQLKSSVRLRRLDICPFGLAGLDIGIEALRQQSWAQPIDLEKYYSILL